MAATTSLRSRTRGARPGALDDLRRPGAPELAVVAFVAVVLAGVAIAGGSRATGGPSTAGLAMGVDRAAARAGGVTVLTVTVANGSAEPFSGTLSAGVRGAARRTTVDVPARGSRTVDVTVPAACGTAVEVALDGPGGVVRQATATASCEGANG
jgi:hypothetical protein